jgi:hypothetical protein
MLENGFLAYDASVQDKPPRELQKFELTIALSIYNI